jgi:hypothetical protein
MRACVRKCVHGGAARRDSSFLLIKFNYAIGAALAGNLPFPNMAARFSFIFDQDSPPPSENEVFLCKNKVLLVLGTKQAAGSPLLRIWLPDSHSF